LNAKASPNPRKDAEIVIAGKPVELLAAPVTPHTVRITVAPLENGKAEPVIDDGSLVPREWPRPVSRFTALAAADQSVKCGNLTLKFSFDPLTIQVDAAGGRPVQRLRIDNKTGSLIFQLGEGPVLGLGEGGPQFDRRGSADRMRSGQGGYRLRTHGGRVPIPWLIGTRGRWAMFIHQPYGALDLTGKEGKEGRFDPARGAGSLPLDVFIVGATEPEQIMAELANLTGHPEMPPLWTLGYQQSHRTLAGREEVLGVAKTFREKKLPCDALIYLGTGFTPSGWNTANGSFSFNPAVFSDPKAMLDELHGLNFRTVLHVVILARLLGGTVGDGCDVARIDLERAGCYWDLHRKVFALGVDGWWPDEGDPLDARSRLARNRMYWEGPQIDRPNERPYALHRNGYAGMQRYGSFLWSGDVYSTWETLKTHVPIAINTGLSGIPYWGTDIGGFVPTHEYTGELHVRWFQFGAFCPLFRAHGRTWHLRLPWGWNTGELGVNELTNYNEAANPDPSELHNAQVEPICRKYLELRYRLLPYLYSVVREGHETGLPIIRALWLHYPDDAAAAGRGDEYLWGRDILVAPVTEKGATSWRVYLPRGSWFDFWTEEKVEGGREVNRPVDLETMPLYVRAGSVIPMGPVKQYTGEKVSGPLTLTVYPGADGEFTIYEDDGASFNYRKGEWMKLHVSWRDAERRLTLRLGGGSRMLPPLEQPIDVRIAGEKTRRPVVFKGVPLEVKL
jgi:alpha-glucosidase/alpha-D-xyloside xylohydrolase